MKKRLVCMICALLCAACVFALASCGVQKIGEDTSARPRSGGRDEIRGDNVPVTASATDPEGHDVPGDPDDPDDPDDTDAPGGDGSDDRGGDTKGDDTKGADTSEPVYIQPTDPIDVDVSDAVLQYTRVTPAVDRSMITSTSRNTLETHGDFSGKEEALSDLEALLDNFSGEITLIAYAVDGSRSLCYNTGTVYQPQCTYKAAFVFSICQYMDEVGFDDSTEITLLEKHRMAGSGTVQRSPAGTKFTVRELVTLCLSISDNTAFNMLHDYFGGQLRNEYMGKIGANSLKTSLLYGNNIPCGDFIVLWNEIYSYFLSGTYYSKLMKSACTNTPYAYAKPVNGLAYSHKSGDGFDFRECHDVELVWDSEPYILAIYTRANVADGSSPTLENAAKIVHERLY